MPSSPPLTDEEVETQSSVISAQSHRVHNEGAGVGAQPSGPELAFNTTILSLLCGPLKPFQEQGEHSVPVFTKISQVAGARVRWKHLEPHLGPSHLHLPHPRSLIPSQTHCLSQSFMNSASLEPGDPDCRGAFPHPKLQLYWLFAPWNEMIQVVIFSVLLVFLL